MTERGGLVRADSGDGRLGGERSARVYFGSNGKENRGTGEVVDCVG